LNTATAVSSGNGRRWSPTLFVRLSVVLHVAAALTLAARPELWVWPAVVIAANQLLIVGATLWPRGTWLGPNLRRLPDAAARRGEICISFDDGPDPRLTPQILEILDRYQAKASFFCIGEKVVAAPELVKEIARRGHSVENHSDHHHNAFALFGLSRLKREVEAAQATVTEITGRAPLFFRAPAGFRNPLLDPVLAGIGLRYVSWTRRGFDMVSGDPRGVLRRLTNGLAAGDLLLLHDNADVVLAVLPDLLEQAAARGLKSVSLAMACEEDTAG